MSAKDIYSILSSKPHNPHYLKRYIKFIELCVEKNEVSASHKYDNHHICPKAKDMFPEYKSLIQNSWNNAKLTPRQHFIAHIILYKSFPSIFSVKHAVCMMSFVGKYTSKDYQKMKMLNSDIFKNNHERSRKISESLKGKIVSDDAKKNMSIARKNSQKVKEHILKMNAARRGVTTSDKQKKVVSERTLGTKFWNNGVICKRSKECPGEGYILGRLRK